MSILTAPQRRLKRRRRVRAKVTGTAERPRISVFRSNRGIHAQLVDDLAGNTLAAVSWTESDLRALKPMEQAEKAGQLLAERAVVGVGYGKANEVPLAIQKGVERAKKNLFRVPKHGSTITHTVTGEFGSGKVFLKPASEGTGVIAGGGVRAVLELAGIHDILSKSLGSQNPINLVKATMAGLLGLRRPEEVADLRGLSVNQVLGLHADETTAEAVEPEAEAPAEEPTPA